MTYPITPNPAIHHASSAAVAQQRQITVTQMQAMGQQMIQGITNAVLYFMTGGIVGAQAGSHSDDATANLQAWFTQLYGQLQSSLTNFSALVTSVGGTTFNDLTAWLQTLKTGFDTLEGEFTAGNTAFATFLQDALATIEAGGSWSTIISALQSEWNTYTTTVSGLASAEIFTLQQLLNSLLGINTSTGQMTATKVSNVLGGSSLGADMSAVSSWSTRLTNDLLITSDVFHLIYAAGTPTDPPGTLSGGKPTWYSAWNDLLSLAGVVNSTAPPTDAAPAVASAITTAQTTANTGVANAATAQSTLNTTNTNLFGSTTPGSTITTAAVPSGISPTKISNVLGGANLGADVSTVNTTVGTNTTNIASQQAWWNSLATDLWIYADLFHAYYPVGSPSDTASTTSGGRRTWYSAIADMKVLFATIGSSPPVIAATDIGGSVSTAQSTADTATTNAQNLADAAHQAVYGGTATGTPTDISTLKSAQTSIPSENLVPVQNPNSSGMVAFGAAGTSWTSATTAANSLTITGSHTIAAGDNYCVVPILYDTNTVVLTSINRTVSYGAVPMSSLGIISVVNGVWLEFFGLFGVPSGTKTITANVASINSIQGLVGASASYSGVGSVGTVYSNQGSGTALSLTASSATGDMVVQAFAAMRVGFAITLGSYNETQRSNSGTVTNSAGNRLVLETGDAPGASSVAFAATASAVTTGWAGMALNLLPSPAVIGSGMRQYRASPTTVAGSAGGPHLFASGFFDTTVGTPTPDMSVSNNAVTVTQAGWYYVSIRALISAAASTGMMTFSTVLYRNGSADHVLSGNSVAFNIVGAQDYTSNICGAGLVYCNAGDVLAPGYYQDGLGTFSSLAFFGESTGVQTHWNVTLANRSLL